MKYMKCLFLIFKIFLVFDIFGSVCHFLHVYAAESAISLYYVKVEIKHYTTWRCEGGVVNDYEVVRQYIKRG